MQILARKTLEHLRAEAADTSESSLKRVLGPLNLITLGIGAIIGAGIFVLTGHAAAEKAGPAIMLSYIFAGIGCAFAGLCYAEFASLIPVAGSAYTYGYATLGEIFAWIIGWDLILEYAAGASTVAVSWAGYFVKLMGQFGVNIPIKYANNIGADLVLCSQHQPDGSTLQAWDVAAKVASRLAVQTHTQNPSWSPEQIRKFVAQQLSGMPHDHAVGNIVAVVAIALVAWVLVRGIKESANFNSAIVIVKLLAVLLFIGVSLTYLFHTGFAPLRQNWSPFIPPEFGWGGIVKGAGIVFFAYIGFDAVSTAAQEAKNPQRDMPLGILGSLVICTVLYILVSGLLTAVVSYRDLDVPAPIATGMEVMGVKWGTFLVDVGSVAGLGSVMLVMLLGQTRVFYSMAHDGLLWEWAGRIHKKYRTPHVSTITVAVVVALAAGTLPLDVLDEMVSIGTLLAFVIVCAAVWVLRHREPDLPRAFKTPAVPLVPILGILMCGWMMVDLEAATWLRLVIWLVIGMFVYFTYGIRHSKVQRLLRGEDVEIAAIPEGFRTKGH